MKVAVVGVTGVVGTVMLNLLDKRKFPITQIIPVASEKSVGNKIVFKGNEYDIVSLNNALIMKPDIALFSAGGSTSKEWAPKFADVGTRVVDNSSAWRMDSTKKLIVSEVNSETLTKDDYIIANPNCSTMQMLVVLAPLHKKFMIKRLVISTYQSVSGAGKAAMDELWLQTKGIYVPGQEVEPTNFTKQIAFNVIPHIDKFLPDGQTKEEWKMAAETKKILDSKIKVTATCVRVPVFVGHAESINIEFEKPIEQTDAREILRNSESILVVDKQEDGGYISPIECVGDYNTFVSRIRQDTTIENGLNLWCVSDNLRKGAALNAVQIAELFIKKFKLN